MTRLKTQLVKPEVQAAPRRFSGLLAGLEAGPVVSWGLLEVVSLRLAAGGDSEARERFASPEEHLELVDVPTYGTVVFRNTSKDERLIVPMHVGFFQPGAQNHATSRALVLDAGETLPRDRLLLRAGGPGWSAEGIATAVPDAAVRSAPPGVGQATQ